MNYIIFSAVFGLTVVVCASKSSDSLIENLPLYLSDDILITKYDRPKRSLTDSGPEPVKNSHVEDEGNEKHGSIELENTEESGLVFIPSFGRRSRRAVRGIVNENSPEEVHGHSTLVKKSRASERLKRDISVPSDNQQFDAESTQVTENDEELTNSESEEEQESGLVFIPSFGRKTRSISKQKRDISPASEVKGQKDHEGGVDDRKISFEESTIKTSTISVSSSTEETTQRANSSEEQEEESGLVFLPSFGRRTRRDTNAVRHENHVVPETKASSSVSEDSDESKEGEEEQESGLVFIPSFGRRTRRDIPTKDKENQEPSTNSPGKTTSKPQENNKFENVQESGLVFLPSFGRRTRREIPMIQNTDHKKESKHSLHGVQGANDDMNLSENGMVFLASFGKKH